MLHLFRRVPSHGGKHFLRISTDFWASLKSAGNRSEQAGCTGYLKRIKSSKRRSYTRARVLHSFRQSGKAEADQEQERHTLHSFRPEHAGWSTGDGAPATDQEQGSWSTSGAEHRHAVQELNRRLIRLIYWMEFNERRTTPAEINHAKTRIEQFNRWMIGEQRRTTGEQQHRNITPARRTGIKQAFNLFNLLNSV